MVNLAMGSSSNFASADNQVTMVCTRGGCIRSLIAATLSDATGEPWRPNTGTPTAHIPRTMRPSLKA